MKKSVFWFAFLALVVLHHDWWFWNDGSLVLGIVPVGLAYHALLSLSAGALWAWAVFDVYRDLFEKPPEAVTVPVRRD